MHALSYPATLRAVEKGSEYVVHFVNLPEAVTGGRTRIEASDEAADCLGSSLAFRMKDKQAIPAPSKPRRGQQLIQVPLWLAPKLALYIAMQEQGLRNTDLAGKLRCHESAVRRLLDPHHASRPEKLEAALAALGKRLAFLMDDAA